MMIATVFFLSACQQPGKNSTGSEYMPDMAHPVTFEANTYNYYYNNTWGSEDEYYKWAQPRKPVKGTVPRGGGAGVKYVGQVSDASSIGAYPYADTEEERIRATAEIIDNPYPITDAGMARGKELYNTFCGICHGAKGDGAGYLVRDDGGVYPVQPANFLLDEFVTASNGRYYHSIMYGKNLMGAYKDKMNAEERWQVIHYIRQLQAKDKGLAYTQYENTLNAVDRPAGDIVMTEEASYDDDLHVEHLDHGHDDHHGAHHDGAHHDGAHHDDGHHEGEHHDGEHHDEHDSHHDGEGHDHHEGDHHEGEHHHDGEHKEEHNK